MSEHQIGMYFAIEMQLPSTTSKGEPILVAGEPVYVPHYYCRKLVDERTNVSFFEWDTDFRYAQRFGNETGAYNFIKVVLESTDGATVVIHPGAIKKVGKPNRSKKYPNNGSLSEN